MKKIILSICLGVASIAGSAGQMDVMNVNLENLLLPFQNKTTVATLHINDLKQTPQKINQVSINAELTKKGRNNISLQINNLAYDYLKGKEPTLRFDISAIGDLSTVVDNESLDEIFDGAEDFLDGLFSQYTKGKYGKAAKIHSEIISKTKDTNNHYKHLKGIISLDVDLEKLPKSTSPKDIEVTSVDLAFELDVNTGFSLHGFIYSNQKHKAFDKNQKVLKEFFDNISINDAKTMHDIFDAFSMLDAFLSNIVESKLNNTTIFEA